MSALVEPNSPGDLLKYEADALYSRERATFAAGPALALGTVVGAVTATGVLYPFTPEATDGTQSAIGVLLYDCAASQSDRPHAVILARHAMVAHHALVWPEGITAEQRHRAIAQLKSLGILVRQGV